MSHTDDKLIVVRLSEVKWSGRQEDVLITYSLGSCVGLTLWDPVSRTGGMAHVFLPSSKDWFGPPGPGIHGEEDCVMPGKYADLAVPYLVSALGEAGASVHRLEAKMAGGAHVIGSLSSSTVGGIGALNVQALEASLARWGIPVTAKDVGGSYGRTMRLFVGSGKVKVSSVNHGEREL